MYFTHEHRKELDKILRIGDAYVLLASFVAVPHHDKFLRHRYQYREPPDWPDNFAKENLRSTFREIPFLKGNENLLQELIMECFKCVKAASLEKNMLLYNVAAEQLCVRDQLK